MSSGIERQFVLRTKKRKTKGYKEGFNTYVLHKWSSDIF